MGVDMTDDFVALFNSRDPQNFFQKNASNQKSDAEKKESEIPTQSNLVEKMQHF